MRDFDRARLRQLRDEREWTQEQLAERARLHSQQVSDYERGHRAPSTQNLASLAKALGVAMEALLTTEEEPAANGAA